MIRRASVKELVFRVFYYNQSLLLEISSVDCNEFEHKMPTFGLFYVVSRFKKTLSLVEGIDCNKKSGTQVLLLMPF